MTPRKSFLKIILTLFCLQLAVLSQGYAQAVTGKKAIKTSGYAPVNGLKVYYEVQGQGKPVVLLHGAYMNIDMNWGQLLPLLSKTRKVITLEMQGHGRTPDTDRPLSWEALAGDVAAVLKYLHIDSADVVGYSFGGTVGYQLSIRHPELVKKLVIISSTYKSEGWQTEVRDVLKTMQPAFLDNTPLKTEYVKLAPDPAHWSAFTAKMIAFDKASYDLGEQNIRTIKAPVLLITGDNDGIDKAELVHTYQLLGGGVFGDMAGLPKSQLAIVPGKTHVTLMMETATIFSMMNSFLK